MTRVEDGGKRQWTRRRLRSTADSSAPPPPGTRILDLFFSVTGENPVWGWAKIKNLHHFASYLHAAVREWGDQRSVGDQSSTRRSQPYVSPEFDFMRCGGKKRAKTRVCLFLFFFFLLTVRCFDQWGGRQSGWWVQGRREGDRDREGGDEVRWGGRGISAQRQRYGASETHGPKKEQEQEVPVAGGSVKKRTSPLQWRCPSRRGNQDPRGRRRRARMRVRSWRRVPAAAGRNARSRLVLLCLSVRLSLCLYLHVCVRAWYDSCSKRFESLQRLDSTQQTEWSFSSIHVE